MKKAKPLTQDRPALRGVAQFLAFIVLPVTQEVLFVPKAEVTDRASVDLLCPVYLLVLHEPGNRAKALATVEAAAGLLSKVGLLVPGQIGFLGKSQGTVGTNEDF